MLSGTFTDGEILKIYRGLSPVDLGIARVIAATPLARLSYWARFGTDLVNVPYGLWKFRRTEKSELFSWTAADDWPGDNDVLSRVVATTPLTLDSIAHFRNGACAETEMLFVSGAFRERDFRLIIQEGDRGRLALPPTLEKHPCRSETQVVSSGNMFVAFVDPVYGPFEAVFGSDRWRIYAMASAHAAHSREWFNAVVVGLINALA